MTTQNTTSTTTSATTAPEAVKVSASTMEFRRVCLLPIVEVYRDVPKRDLTDMVRLCNRGGKGELQYGDYLGLLDLVRRYNRYCRRLEPGYEAVPEPMPWDRELSRVDNVLAAASAVQVVVDVTAKVETDAYRRLRIAVEDADAKLEGATSELRKEAEKFFGRITTGFTVKYKDRKEYASDYMKAARVLLRLVREVALLG